MIRHFKLLAVVMLVSLVAVGTAFAGTITVETNNGVNAFYTTSAQGLQYTCNNGSWPLNGGATALGNVDLGAVISYVPTTALNPNDEVTFTLDNGTFQNSDYRLIVWEGQADIGDIDGDGNLLEYQEVGAFMDPNPSGLSAIRIRINGNVLVQPDWILYLVKSNSDTNTNTDMVVPDTLYTHNINIRPGCGTSYSFTGNGVGIRASVKDDNGQTVPPGAASEKNFIYIDDQFDLALVRGDSQIDATNEQRLLFYEEGAADSILFDFNNNDDTDLAASSGVVTFGNDDNLDDPLVLANWNSGAPGAARLVLRLGGTSNNWSGLDNDYVLCGGSNCSSDRVYFDYNWAEDSDGSNAVFYCAVNNSGTNYPSDPACADHVLTAIVDGGSLPVAGTSGEDDVYVGVDGDNILFRQIWPFTAELQLQNAGPNLFESDNNFITWSIDGYQAIVPYMATWAGYGTTCIVDNRSGVDASIYADIISSESGFTTQNIELGIVGAERTTRLSFSGTDATNFGDPTTGADDVTMPLGLAADNRYATLLTITTIPNDVFVNCFQNLPGSPTPRMVPVLTDEFQVDWRQ